MHMNPELYDQAKSRMARKWQNNGHLAGGEHEMPYLRSRWPGELLDLLHIDQAPQLQRLTDFPLDQGRLLKKDDRRMYVNLNSWLRALRSKRPRVSAYTHYETKNSKSRTKQPIKSIDPLSAEKREQIAYFAQGTSITDCPKHPIDERLTGFTTRP